EAELVAERLLMLMRQPFQVAGTAVSITMSIGVAIGDRPSAGELLRDADIALYQAKDAGKNRYAIFHPDMHTALRDHVALDMDVRRAMERGELSLVYQPICALGSTEVTGVEALLRWCHPERGMVPPDLFIPLL